MAQKKMPIDKVEETTKTVERVEWSYQLKKHYSFFNFHAD
jgi:hypothetical protein